MHLTAQYPDYNDLITFFNIQESGSFYSTAFIIKIYKPGI